MNLLKKQGVLNSISLYIGTALSFFNGIILFNRFLPIEAIGFFGLLTSVCPLFAQIASIGFTGVITRYFPFFKTPDLKHKGFPLFVFWVCLAGFLILSVFFFLFRELILDHYSDNEGASLMSKYYFYILPISFLTLAFLIQESFSQAVFKNVFPAFLREVGLRLFTMAAVLMVAFKLADLKDFWNIYLFGNLILFIIICYYNAKIKVFKLSRISEAVRSEAPKILNYGIFSMLSASSIALIRQSMPIMLLQLLSTEEMVGVFAMFLTIASVITLTSRALNTTSYQIISEAWKDDDLAKIGKIYHKTSLVQLLIGALMLIGLIINRDFLLYLLHKDIYASFFPVFIMVGLGFLVDITGGLNQAIISFSKSYKVVMMVLITFAIAGLILNFLLISSFGIFGAAWSYLLTMVGLNFTYWLYLKNKFNLQPFNQSHLYVLLIALVTLLIGYYIPAMDNIFIDMVVRSGLVTFIYLLLVYIFKVSDDINSLYSQVMSKVLRR